MNAIENFKSSRKELFDIEGIQPEYHVAKTAGPIEKVHYMKLGKGEPLILIHGGGSNAMEWFNIIKPLSKQYQLFVVDRPGCGLSDKVDYTKIPFRESAIAFISSFMNAIGLEQASFLSNSMGAYFSICFAMEHPERIKKLLLIGAPAGMNKWIPIELRLLGTKNVNKLLMKTLARPSVENLTNLHKKILVADAKRLSDTYLLNAYYNQIIPGNAESFLSLLESVLTLNGWKGSLYIGDQLALLRVPVRFIWGEKDAFESPESGKPKTLGIADCQFEEVKDAGHCPWLDQPERCTQLILSMLNKRTETLMKA